MILKASQRAGGMELARHLMNVEDNEHVTIHELRGFISDNLHGAFKEAQAISQGTKCKQFLFSLSLNPPENEIVPVEVFEKAIADIERKLGIAGQPRALVFHEKEGRRHAHCVWSRIDVNLMKAINLPHFKMKLMDISRQLYLEHGWKMPNGFLNSEDRDPLNFSQAEYQQSKRAKQDPRDLKKFFQDCWTSSDSLAAFTNALSERGFHLAKGDRRGHVAVDWRGEVYAISRWVGVKAKDVRAKLGNVDKLSSVEDVLQIIEEHSTDHSRKLCEDAETLHNRQNQALQAKRADLVIKHRQVRETLQQEQEARRIEETKNRSTRLPKGLKAIWFRVSGKYQSLCTELEEDAQHCNLRDQDELQKLIERQLTERRLLQHEFRQLRHRQFITMAKLHRDMGKTQQGHTPDAIELAADPNQPLILPDDSEALYSAAQIRKRPERILEIITDKEETFSRNDIMRSLAKYIDDPIKLRLASDEVMRSNELVELHATPTSLYSTREMERLKTSLAAQSQIMAGHKAFNVNSHHVQAAIIQQNAALQKSAGANLSDEQCRAIQHILCNNQLSVVIGLAGTGKSTMLAAANEAWTTQGYRVRGATLSGKAADGLQEASGIQSRTLASLELSWKNGYNRLQPNDVLVIDEAGMVGARQMVRFIEETCRYGAKLVLVGDPEQLQPINAGTPFRDISNQVGCAALSEVRRQKTNWQCLATLDLAQGRTADALRAYSNHGAVEHVGSKLEAITALVQDYMIDWELRGANASRLALAHRRKDVHSINQAIRFARQSNGEISDEKIFNTNHGPRAFAVGDRIMFTRNDAMLGVRNGALGTVQSIGGNQLTVCFDATNKETRRYRTILINRYSAIDHGYATTIHKSQGVTVDHTFVLSTRTMDRHTVYVAMSRHREALKFYTDVKNTLLLGKISKLTFANIRPPSRDR